MTAKIHIAFRFHGNFYHSYRGDTPDELGFGQDIRVIRHLIATLDELNARGIPVQGAWDFENLFSLEQIMPAHCPDIITALQRRVRAGQDEMQLMSYNNGLINAHTAREFEAAIRRGLTNPQGSGIFDLFGVQSEIMVRPQEMMFTPIHLKLYRACGVGAVSLYYSALPFNAFSTFIPPLSPAERYNPLTLSYPGIAETMTLLPCYNTGDLADHLTLRRWVNKLRRDQLAMPDSCDMLITIDMDADDWFWEGMPIPLISGRFSTIGGLKGIVENVCDLDFVEFTTPGRYLAAHAPLRTISIGQDMADGSFDGLSSWAEKWSNQRLWTGLERARLIELQARRLACDGRTQDNQAAAGRLSQENRAVIDLPQQENQAAIDRLLDEAFEARLRLLSTTHFGMAAPVMNLAREAIGRDLAAKAVQSAAAAFALARPLPTPGRFSLLDYPRHEASEIMQFVARPSRALIRLPLRLADGGQTSRLPEDQAALTHAPAREGAPLSGERLAVISSGGQPIASAVLPGPAGSELVFVESFQAGERKDYAIVSAPPGDAPHAGRVEVSGDAIANERLRLALDQVGQVNQVVLDGDDYAYGSFLRSGLKYGRREQWVEQWQPVEAFSPGVVGVVRSVGQAMLPGGLAAVYQREILLAAGLPYLYVSLRIDYPRTPDRGFDPGKALRLQQAWDAAWQAVMPCEISPRLSGLPERPLRVWKHNFCDHVSAFRLDYGRYSKNDTLDSVNNQVTHGWVAVSDGERGLLVAQTADVTSSLAFCPLRTCRQGGALRVRLNPFGSYWGRQYQYPTADTGLGRFMAVATSASGHVRPYAPSFNGRRQEFRLLIAPYSGDAPPEQLRWDAEAFAYPYLLLEDAQSLAPPLHRSWDGDGLGAAAALA